MSSELVSVEREGAIAILRLNRAPANAINLELTRDFETALDGALEMQPRALVLTGTGSLRRHIGASQRFSPRFSGPKRNRAPP